METELQKKLRLIVVGKLFIKIRWFFTSIPALTGLFTKLLGGGAPNQNFSPLVMGLFISSAFLLNLAYFFFYRFAEKFSLKTVKAVSFIQLLVDLFFIIFIIYLAGGIVSISFFYFCYITIASGFFYGLRGVYIITSLASFFYCSLIWGQFLGLVPYISRYNNSFEYELSKNFAAVFANTFTIVATLFIVAAFVGMYSSSIRRKEEELTSERDKEEAIIANLLDGLIYFDEAGRIDMVNPAAERLLDFRSDEVIGKRIKDFDLNKYTLLNQLFSHEKPAGEMVPVTKQDTIYEIDTVNIKDRYEAPLGGVKLVHDISREKFVEKMKSEIITIAGHQLRTPLSAVKGAVDLILSGSYEKKGERERVLREIYRYNDRMISLVDDLLEASSIEEGRYDYKFEAVDIDYLLQSLKSQFKSQSDDKAIALKVETVNNLRKVELDVYKIKLALGAIINNAFTYTALGGKVSIKAEFSDAKTVVISIRDNGIGIPAHQQEKVFGKFFRADNALKYQTEGNGLDLFVAKNIIDNHNGKIRFESEEGFGTTFYVELPAERPRRREKTVKPTVKNQKNRLTSGWKKVKSKIIHKNPWYVLREDDVSPGR